MKTPGLVAGGIAATMSFAAAPMAPAQERSLDEIKTEVMRRAGRINPFEGIRRDDAEQVVNGLTSLDRDHWAAAWCKVGLAYEGKADARAKAGASGQELAELYTLAFEYCHIARYPVASTPGKKEAYGHSLRLFRKAAKHYEPPLAIVEIPFEGKTLVGYLQIPPRGRQAAGGHALGRGRRLEGESPARLELLPSCRDRHLDRGHAGHRREPRALRGSRSRAQLFRLDRSSPQRDDVDGGRIGVWGGSFGAYWAARLAFVEAKRIKGAVFHGGNVHYGFQEKWLVPAFTTGGATYLFGPASLLEARGQAMGTKTMEEFLEAAPRLSLKELGLLDQPSAPLLGVNGKLDDQAPVEDIYLLMEHGNPKEARIYPQGHHMGRTPGMPRGRDPQHDRGMAEREAREVESRPLAPLRFLPIVRAARYR